MKNKNNRIFFKKTEITQMVTMMEQLLGWLKAIVNKAGLASFFFFSGYGWRRPDLSGQLVPALGITLTK